MGSPEQFALAVNLSVQMIRKVATGIGISSHNVNKPESAKMIINKVGKLEDKVARAVANGEDIDVSAIALVDENGRTISVSIPRLLNILFSKKIVLLLANRGANLTKDDLENKRKVDQELFSIITVEYNDKSNVSYGLHAFTDFPQKVDPSNFKIIPLTAWKYVLKKFKQLVKEYEQHIKAWTKSGNNGRFHELSANDLNAIDPDIAKCTSKYMIYMHYFMRQHHSILATCIALLPSDVARRSTKRREMSSNNTVRVRKESGSSEAGEKEGGKYVGTASGMQKALGSIASKNNAQQRKIELDMKNSEKQSAMTASLRLSSRIEEEKQLKRGMEEELRKYYDDDRRVMNEKVRAVKGKIDSNVGGNDDDDDDDSNFFNIEPLSREDLITWLLSCTKRIKKWEQCFQAAEMIWRRVSFQGMIKRTVLRMHECIIFIMCA